MRFCYAHIQARRYFFCAVAVVIVTGCGGGHNATLPTTQGGFSSSEMNASYPRSQSPGSFKVASMPHTQPQPANGMPDALSHIVPQSIEQPLQWSELPGSAVDVADAPDGSLWALSPLPAGVDKSIWHYVSGTWTNISGRAASIAVGPSGTLYAVNGSTGGVYAYNGSTWSSLGGGARWVTVGADGAVYVLSNAHVLNGNSAIWKYASGTWMQQPGSGSQLAGSFDPNTYSVSGVGPVDPDGYFVINSSGGIYYFSPAAGYVQFPGAASGVAPITGGFFAFAFPAAKEGEGLSYFDYVSATATAASGTGVSVAAGPGSGGLGFQLDVVNSGNAIWTTTVSIDSASGLQLAADSPSQFVSAATTLTVPAEPPATGTLFLWPGLQPFGANFFPIGNGVLQPVLTWGPSCAPGDQPPAYSSWWVSAQYVNTDGNDPGYTGCEGGPIMSVNVGDSLAMTMTLNKTTWTQKVVDAQSGHSVSFAIDMQGQAQNFLYFFIEGYGQFPVSSVVFSNTSVTFSAVPMNSCTLTGAEAPDSRDSFSTPVLSNDGLTCSIKTITMYSPVGPLPASQTSVSGKLGAPPMSGQVLKGRRPGSM